MENINVKSDIRNFIEQNATNQLPPYKFEFIPYISDLDPKSYMEFQDVPNDIVSNVKGFISKIFFVESPNSEVFKN